MANGVDVTLGATLSSRFVSFFLQTFLYYFFLQIQTWTAESGEEKFREIIMKSDSTRSLVQSFKPFATNYARVLAFNGAYNGPPSNVIRFETPEGKPGPVDMLECFPMGSSALLLAWKKPQEVNGILTGYRIYYQEVDGTR